MRGLVALAAVAAFAAPVLAGPAAGPVSVRDPVIRPAAAGQPTTAAYMTLVNPGQDAVRLKAVSCACAAMVEPHQSSMAGGVMRMRPAGPVIIPPHGSLSFQPGGLHLMVMDLKRAIKPGDSVPMQLSFDRGAAVTVSFKAVR